MNNRISRRLFALGGAALAAAVVRPVRAADLSGVTLRVADQVATYKTKLAAAGLLDNLPYRIEWSVYPAAVNLHEALKADAADIGGANDSPTVSAIANGSNVSAVAAWSNGGGGTDILVPHDSKIGSVAELRGKTVSPTTRGSVAHFLLVGALQKAGVPLDQVKFAFLDPVDAAAAFAAGSIDAWATWGIYSARVQGQLGARVISNGAGINSGLLVYSATPSALSNPGKVAAMADFCDRIDRGFVWSREHKDAHIAWFKSWAKQSDAIAQALYGNDAQYRRVPIDDAFVGRLRKTFEVWKSVGVLHGDIDFSRHVYRDLPVA
jgi:sulfonate transport system substrate-binding protein